jgi:protease-4
MKDFFRSLLASLAALILFVGGIIGLVMAAAVALAPAKPVVAAHAILTLNLSTRFTESAQRADPAGMLQQALTGGEPGELTVAGVLQALDRAAKDPAISALYLTGNVEADGVSSGPAALKELREAIERFKKVSGKPVIAYNHAWSKREYYLCAGASKLYLNPSGDVDVTGLSAEPMFFAGAFKKYGVEVQVTRVGRYKSAVEPYILDRMSDANREQLTSLLGDIWAEWKSAVAADRKCSPEQLQAMADEQGVLTAHEALKAGLVDQLAAPDQVLDELKSLSGRRPGDTDFPQVDLDTYLRMADAGTSRNRIALVFAEGEIVDGRGRPDQVGGERLSRELRKLRQDPEVKAIVMRVNSPGGSALASELIQRELILARKEKPVIVSMGHLAASGGYWISTYADRIFAEPNSITGSIGVYGMLPNVQKLANNFGVTWDRVQTAKLADLTSIARPKTPAELARIQFTVDDIYDQFLTRVSTSRNLPRERVEELAQGRVWSGLQAQKLGLVDQLGGLQDAVREAAKRAHVAGDFRLDMPFEPKSALERLLKLVSPGDDHADTRMGPASELENRFRQVLGSLQALNDPRGVYARMPFDLALR